MINASLFTLILLQEKIQSIFLKPEELDKNRMYLCKYDIFQVQGYWKTFDFAMVFGKNIQHSVKNYETRNITIIDIEKLMELKNERSVK